MAIYESEHTKFMREWMKAHPEEREEQQKGRALWLDKPQDLQTQGEYAAGKVAHKPYPYATE